MVTIEGVEDMRGISSDNFRVYTLIMPNGNPPGKHATGAFRDGEVRSRLPPV
jgi:hypothetical protein